MSRYRKVEQGLWFDRKVRQLSRPKPNARDLWIYLLCGPRTTIFPGLVVATEAVAADDLGWPVSADLFSGGDSDEPRCFRDCWKELATKDMVAADWVAGVITLPRGLMRSTGETRESARPGSVNTFKGWGKWWGEIPDCDLKDGYLLELGRFARALDAEMRRNPQLGSQGNPQGSDGVKGNRGHRQRGHGSGDTPYHDSYLQAYSTDLGRVANASPTGLGHARVLATVPVPDPVLPDPVVAAPPDPDPDHRADLPGDRERGGVRREPEPRHDRAAAAPAAGAPGEKSRILRDLVRLHVEIFNRVRSELAARVPAMQPVGDPAERALLALMDQQATLVGFEDAARHVLAVREAEALHPSVRSVQYLGLSVWHPSAFGVAKTMEVGQVRSKAGAGRSSAAAAALARAERLRREDGA